MRLGIAQVDYFAVLGSRQVHDTVTEQDCPAGAGLGHFDEQHSALYGAPLSIDSDCGVILEADSTNVRNRAWPGLRGSPFQDRVLERRRPSVHSGTVKRTFWGTRGIPAVASIYLSTPLGRSRPSSSIMGGSPGELHCSIAAAAMAMKLLISSAVSPPPLVRCMKMMPTRSLAGSTQP
jgi:hypothetical protein